ncbi:selenoprotein S [Syngnathus scovelli]|uniref:selenoprotein S n=1 Tax=Syngnathus scovelli TaxID=161590 RepID=UPI00210F775E|nr:selenoprotein S [Syngnathus scovelli]
MDDVEIADVDENGEVLPEEGEKVLKRQQQQQQQQQHDHLSSVGFMVGEPLWAYGCYLLVTLAALCTLLIYLAKKRRSKSLPAPTLQDAEEVVRRQEAMEASRRKMQQEQDAKAAIFREKRKQQEEEKRRQKIEEWDSLQLGKSFKGASRRLQESSDEGASSSTALKPKSHKKPLRSSEYSPLSGEGGGSCSWRPGRRGPSPSGG